MPDKYISLVEGTIDLFWKWGGVIIAYATGLIAWVKVDLIRVNGTAIKAHERIDEQQKELCTKEDLAQALKPIRDTNKIILNHIINQSKSDLPGSV